MQDTEARAGDICNTNNSPLGFRSEWLQIKRNDSRERYRQQAVLLEWFRSVQGQLSRMEKIVAVPHAAAPVQFYNSSSRQIF